VIMFVVCVPVRGRLIRVRLQYSSKYDDLFYRYLSTCFPGTPVIPNGLINKVDMAANMEVTHRLKSMNFYSSVLTCLWSLMSAQSPAV
jgi:hypothetical protein